MIVGEAKVVIRAIGNKLESDISKSLDRAGVRAGASGEKAGKNYSDGVVKGVEKNASSIDKPIRDAMSNAGSKAGDKAGENIASSINRKVKGSTRDVERSGEVIGRKIGDRMSRGFERSRFTRKIGSALVKIGIFIPVIGVVVEAISALVSGLFALGAAVGTASASLVVLGNGLTAGVQGIGIMVIAMKGVGKALQEGFKPDNLEKFNAALEKIAPAARPFVKQLVGLKSDFTALRDAAAAGLFPGLEDSLSRIAPLLPRMRKGFKEAGDAAGDAVRNFTRAVTSKNAKSNFAGLTTANNQIVRQFGNILGDVSRTLLALFDAANPLTSRFVSYLEAGAKNLRKLTEAGNLDGTLTKYLNSAGDVAALLGNTLANIVRGLYDIGKVAQPSGVSLLRSFNAATEKLANFTDEAENVKKIEKYFDSVATNVRSLGDLFNDVGAAFIRMGADPGIAATAKALQKIVPDLEEALTKSVASIGPAIAELLGQILQLFSALEESGAIKSVIEIFTAVAKALTFVFNIPGIGRGLLYLLQFVAVMKALKLVMRGGGFVFNGIRDGITSVSKAASVGGGAIKRFKSDIAGAVAIKRGYGLKGLIELSGGMERISRIQSPRLRVALQRVALSTAAMADRMGASVPFTRRLGTGLVGVAAGAASATGGIRRFVAVNGRAIGSAAILGVALSGVAGKAGLQNAALGASAGLMVGGPWGAAIGAATGALIDFGGAYINANDSIKRADAALKSNNFDQLTSSLAEINSELDGFQDARTMSGFWDGISDVANLKRNIKGVGYDFDGAAGKAQKISDALIAAKQASDRLYDATTRVDASIRLNDLKAQIAELKKGGTFNLKTNFSETATSMRNVADTLRDLKVPDFQISDKMQQLARDAGLGKAAADLLGDTLAGVPLKIDDITNTKLDVDDRAFLKKMGVNLSAIDDLREEAGKKLQFDLSDFSKNRIGGFDPQSIKDQKASLQSLLDLKPTDAAWNTPIKIKTNAGDVKTDFQSVLEVMYDVDQTPATVSLRKALGFETVVDELTTLGALKVNPKVLASVDPKSIINVSRLDSRIRNLPAVKNATVKGKVTGKDLVDALKTSINETRSKTPKVRADVNGKDDVDKLRTSIKNTEGKSIFLNVKAALGGLSGKLRKILGLATGGFVYGPGTGISDSIPAMLSNGEFVVKASQAKKFGPLLERINDNKPIPKPLPNMKAIAGSGSNSGRRGASSLRAVGGYVTLTPESKVLLQLSAEEVYDDSASYDDSSRGM